MDILKGMDLTKLSQTELISIIYKLGDTIGSLEARILELEEKLSRKDERTSDKKTVSSWVKSNVKKKKATKRKKRESSYVRMKDEPTATVSHTYTLCPDCGGSLGKPSVAYTRQIIDIPILPATVTEHIIYKRSCFSCHRRVYPRPDLSSYVIGNYRIGINLMGLIATMREQERLPIDVIQQHIQIFYRLKISAGEIVKIVHAVARWGKTEYRSIQEALLTSSYIHADETGGRENGVNGYFWNFSNANHQFVVYRRSRGKKVVAEVLGENGENYEGVIISDFYTAYNEYCGYHQRCWVHYLRDIEELKKEYPKDKLLKVWSRDIRKLYDTAKAYTGPPASLPIGLQVQMREQKEEEFKHTLTDICTPYLTKETVFSKLNARALRYISELFTFVRIAGVPSHNNPAEKAVRHLVISRKISGGTRSSKGSETKSILTSLFGTWKLQNLNPFEQTKLLLLQAACQKP